MSQIKRLSAVCPICKESVDVDVQVDSIENAAMYPVSVMVQHGKPRHFMIAFIDAHFCIRGVEGHKLIVAEDDTHDVLELALKERKSLNRLADVPTLLSDLTRFRGIEFADNKGVAVVSLPEAGPITRTISSPSGRIKTRVITSSPDEKKNLEPVLTQAINDLEDAPPLSPTTLVLLLEVIEESLNSGYTLDSKMVTNIAECTALAPTCLLKQNVFEVMCQHVITDDTGAQEIAGISNMLDGKTSLLSMIRFIQSKGGSVTRLLFNLENLRKNDAITYTVRDDLSKR